MTQRLCMFCGDKIEADQLTMEHFVPRGLWEKGHRPKKMKTLPAHKSCNKAFSVDNEYFRDVIAMEKGVEDHPEARRVQQGALSRKFKERFGSIVKTLKNVALRRVRTPSGIEIGRHPSFEVDWGCMERVLFNVMKGIFYASQGQPLPQDFILFVRDARQLEPAVVDKAASFMVPWQSFGDSVFACRYGVSSKKPIEKMTCLMRFYQNRVFLGEAASPSLLGVDGELFVPVRDGATILVPRWSAER